MGKFFKILGILVYIVLWCCVIWMWINAQTPDHRLTAVLGAIILVIGFIIWIYRSAAKKSEPEPVTPELPKKEEPESPETQSPDSSAINLKKTFARAIKSLKNNVSGKDFRYDIPWVLMLGQESSGKTELLENIGLSPLIDKEVGQTLESDLCKWWLFEQGVVIDVAGDIVFKEEDEKIFERGIWSRLKRKFGHFFSKKREEFSWWFFLSQLQKHRPERPIDGVALTISCEELLTQENTIDAEAIRKKAELLYRRIWYAQKLLGIRFPVYVLITQCGQIRGFKEFGDALEKTPRLTKNMLGWSVPYNTDTAYSQEWSQEAFKSVYQELLGVVFEIFADVENSASKDELFMLPDVFKTLENPLKIYLDNLFRDSAYHKFFMFRGLYFCGSSSSASFARDIFEKKVFSEHRLTRPLDQIIVTRHRKERFFLGIAFLFMVISCYGLYRDYTQFVQDHRAMKRFLEGVNQYLDVETKENGILKIKTSNTRELAKHILAQKAVDIGFKERARVLRLSDELANVNDLRFISIPASWLGFGHVHDTIRKAVKAAYAQIIFKAMFVKLVLKAKAIFEFQYPATQALYSQTRHSIEANPAFYRLWEFVKNISDLENYIKLYNNISTSKDSLYNFSEVVSYLFGIQLGENFYIRSSYYGNIREEAAQWKMDAETIRAIRLAASDFTIKELAEYLEENLPQSNVVYEQLQILAEELDGFDSQSRIALQHDQLLDDLIQKYLKLIDETEILLKNSRYQWLARKNIGQVEPFANLLAQIDNSKFLGKDFSREVNNFGERAFEQTRNILKNQTSSLTGPLLRRQKDVMELHLSDAVFQFKEDLKSLQSYDFISTQGRHYNVRDSKTCPIGTRLEWNNDMLSDTMTSIDQYEGFVRREKEKAKVTKFSRGLRNMVLKVAKTRMDKEVLYRISKAQHCELLKNASEFVTRYKEANIKSEILNFKEASKLLAQLRADCERLNLKDSYTVLTAVLYWQAEHLLEAINSVLNEETLYQVRGGDFSWWDNKNTKALSLLSFDVVDANELAYYLNLQRNRIQHLAYEYAEPVLTLFLTNQMDNMALNRWRRILEEFQKYENKKPGNSLGELEKFILFELDHINLFNYKEKLSNIYSPETSGDFFVKKTRQLKQQLYERCQTLSASVFLERYETIKTFFNKKLRGRFPFAQIAKNVTRYPEAAPENIREFYRLFDQLQLKDRDLIRIDPLFGASGKTADGFLSQMEIIRPLFAAYLDDSDLPEKDKKEDEAEKDGDKKTSKKEIEKFDRPTLDFDIVFRTNQAQEKQASRIMDWTFRVADQTFERGDAKHSGRWHWGDPVSLSLRWPKNYPGYPAIFADQAGVTIDDTTKTLKFQFDNKWSLFRLLKLHAAALGDFESPGHLKASRQTLKFEAYTVHVDLKKRTRTTPKGPADTRAYVRLSVITPGKKKKILNYIDMTRAFPYQMPELTLKFNVAADNSVHK